jgi:hypothetical protein
MNNFLKIGLTGLFITVVIYLVLSFATDITFTSMSAFYIVWVVFISIGVGQFLRQKSINKS